MMIVLLAIIVASAVLQLVLEGHVGDWLDGVALAGGALTFFTGDALFLQPLRERLRRASGDWPMFSGKPLF